MQDCSNIRPLLGAYLDGELSDEQRAAVARHAHQCPDCARELEDFSRIDAIAREASAPVVDEREWSRIWSAVRAASVPARSLRRWLRPLASFAAAAVVLIAVGLGLILYPGSAMAGPAWEVVSVEQGSPGVTVGYYYDAEADVTVIYAVPSADDNGADSHGGTT